jgi:pimeloyl-ACP methyl ester carboxylesterase
MHIRNSGGRLALVLVALTLAILFSLIFLSIPHESKAAVVIAEGIASAGADFRCSQGSSPGEARPPRNISSNILYDESNLTTRPTGSLSAGVWATASWNVSSGRIIASGSSTAGFNRTTCTPPEGGAGGVYGRGHADFSVTLNLDRAYIYTSTVTGRVSGISNGSGILQAGQHTISGQAVGHSGSFSLDISLSPAPPDVSISLTLEHPRVWANGREESLVTARVENGGIGVAGHAISLVSDSNTTIIDPPGAVTDSMGEAKFTVRSNSVGRVLLTASDTSNTALVGSTTIEFVQKRVVVLLQGINTELFANIDDPVFPHIRSRLTGFQRATRGSAEEGEDCLDDLDSDGDGIPNDGCPLIINYSYNGGMIGQDGIWKSYSYSCLDTAQKLDSSLALLVSLLQEVSAANPNTRFVVVGHSQGGFLALQSLRWASNVALDAVVTLDGALGGTPSIVTGAAATFSCWGDPAARDFYEVWISTNAHSTQGTTAKSGPGQRSNGELVTTARSLGIRIMTIGSRDDCVFNPARCAVGFIDNSSSQIVETANVHLMLDLKQNCPFICIKESHSEVLGNPTVLNAVETFIGAPTVP